MSESSRSQISSQGSSHGAPAALDIDDASEVVPGEVATHVLVPAEQAEKLRELSRRTRVNQSDYLREAVDDLLSKYAGEGVSE